MKTGIKNKITNEWERDNKWQEKKRNMKYLLFFVESFGSFKISNNVVKTWSRGKSFNEITWLCLRNSLIKKRLDNVLIKSERERDEDWETETKGARNRMG